MGIFERLLGGHHGGGYGQGRGHGNRYRNDQALPSENQWGRGPAVPSTTAALIACAACGTGNDTGSRFCGQCGATLAPSLCAGCGSAMTNGVKFCGQCGKAR